MAVHLLNEENFKKKLKKRISFRYSASVTMPAKKFCANWFCNPKPCKRPGTKTLLGLSEPSQHTHFLAAITRYQWNYLVCGRE